MHSVNIFDLKYIEHKIMIATNIISTRIELLLLCDSYVPCNGRKLVEIQDN